jgi:hypothetical protein
VTGYTTITAANLKDLSGNPLYGTVTFTGPVNNQGQTVSALAGGGPVINGTATFLVQNGIITGDNAIPQNPAQVADCLLSSPENIGYTVKFYNVRGICIPMPGYLCVQPSGATWSLDSFEASQGPLTTVTNGPPGLSAYQEWLAAGNTGSEAAFLASLIGESAYQVWLAAGNTGTQAEFLASLIGSVSAAAGLNVLSGGALSFVIAAIANLDPKWMFVIPDLYQRVLLGITAAGDTVVGANLNVAQNLTVEGLFAGLKFALSANSVSDLLTLTDPYQRALLRVLAGGGLQINSPVTLTGGLQLSGPGVFRVNGMQVVVTRPTTIIHTARLGQSNQLGFSAENALSGASKEGNLMQRSGDHAGLNLASILPVGVVYPLNIAGTALMQEVNIDSTTPPAGDWSGAAPGSTQSLGETGCVVAADARTRMYRAKFLGTQTYLYTIAAQGATPMLDLYGAGMAPLAYFAAQVAAAKAMYGAAYMLDWICMDQGEADAGNASYVADIQTAVANLQAAYEAATGNTNTVRILAVQQSSTPSGGFTSGSTGTGVMDTALAWMTLARAYPAQYFVCQSTYPRNCMIGSVQHIGAIGQIAKSLIEARIQFSADYEGGTGNGLRFSSIARSGTLITVTWEVPVPPIVLDTEIVAAVAGSGLEYSNTPPSGGSTPTIVSVSTLRPDGALALQGNVLYVVLSADPGAATNETMRCAYTWPTGGDPTLGTGARSNIRDSDKRQLEHFPDQVYANGSVGINPYNWACVDSMAVTVVTA